MGVSQRRKGRRGENELVAILQDEGFLASRISEAGMPGPDVEAFGGRTIEVKRRQRLPTATLERWAATADLVVMRADHQPWMVYVPLTTLADLLDEARQGRI